MRRRTGGIYGEYTNSGGRLRRKFRYVATITVQGKRYRCRSTSYANVRAWLDGMLEKFPTYDAHRRKTEDGGQAAVVKSDNSNTDN